MSKKAESTIVILGLIIALLTFLFGDDIYSDVTGRSFIDDFRGRLDGQITPTPSFASSERDKLSSSDYGVLLYEDTFDVDTGVWTLENGNTIHDGEIIIMPGTATNPYWDTEYSDFVFETEFRFTESSNNQYGGFSAYLRYHNCSGPTGNCSTQVGVSDSGEIAAWRPNGTNNYERLLAPTYATEFGSNSPNKLTVIVKDSEFRVFLNDVFVRSFTDSSYESGVIVLDTDGVATAFNDLRVYSLP